jgi:hypothetical protein
MNKSIRYLLLIIICILPYIIGMGSNKGESPPGKIPVPVKKFTATFIDQMDVTTECRDVSIEGGTLIEGKKGDGKFTISFENIHTIVFRLSEGKLSGIVKLIDGNAIEIVLNKDQRVYGNTKYGTFQIKLLDLKKMIIGGSQKRGS